MTFLFISSLVLAIFLINAMLDKHTSNTLRPVGYATSAADCRTGYTFNPETNTCDRNGDPDPLMD